MSGGDDPEAEGSSREVSKVSLKFGATWHQPSSSFSISNSKSSAGGGEGKVMLFGGFVCSLFDDGLGLGWCFEKLN